MNPKAELIIPAKVRRSETLVKGYNGTVQLCFRSKPAFNKLPLDIQKEIIQEAKRLRFNDFTVNRESGEVFILSPYIATYFSIDTVDEGDWEYDEGEVTTLGVNYDSDLRLH